MKILFHLGHPAHFHLFKHSIQNLKNDGFQCLILIKKKDVLEDLLAALKMDYINILPEGKKKGKLNLLATQFKQIRAIYKIAKKEKVALLCGTSASIGIVGKLLKIPNFNFNEDDEEAVPLYAKMAYPWATKIFAPKVCSVGKWKYKKVAYESYHELAYLHPNQFSPSKQIAEKYVDLSKPYFIIRFTQLTAHHDKGVKGISETYALKLIELLSPFGQIYISSEIKLSSDLEKYRLAINPLDIHHVMAFNSIFIGDSQTMCAESAVLGVPFFRMNDFVGRISYLKELEEKYKLGYGFQTNQKLEMLQKLYELLQNENFKMEFIDLKEKMLADKIDLSVLIYQSIVDFMKQKD